jgi:hypothetical protein
MILGETGDGWPEKIGTALGLIMLAGVLWVLFLAMMPALGL